jgi:hypothetical protein
MLTANGRRSLLRSRPNRTQLTLFLSLKVGFPLPLIGRRARPRLTLRTVDADELADRTSSSWHVFNDFLVRPISEDEALGFPGSWKVNTVSHSFGVAFSIANLFFKDSGGTVLPARGC